MVRGLATIVLGVALFATPAAAQVFKPRGSAPAETGKTKKSAAKHKSSSKHASHAHHARRPSHASHAKQGDDPDFVKITDDEDIE